MSAQLETTAADPYAGRKANSYKVRPGIYLGETRFASSRTSEKMVTR